jgi:hypothetical protein
MYLPNKSVQAVTLLTYIQEMFGSNLGRDIEKYVYYCGIPWFSSVHAGNTGVVPKFRLQSLPIQFINHESLYYSTL